VFQAMLENAVHICEAKFGTLFRFEGDAYLQSDGLTPEVFRCTRTSPGPGSGVGCSQLAALRAPVPASNKMETAFVSPKCGSVAGDFPEQVPCGTST
jgi:hypothetical protein